MFKFEKHSATWKIFLTQFSSLLKSQRFYLLGIATTACVLHLGLVENNPKASPELVQYLICWTIIIIALYRNNGLPNNESNTKIDSSFIGLVLLFLVIVRLINQWLLDVILLRLTPLITALALGLIAFGWRGTLRQWRLFSLACLMICPIPDLISEKLLPWNQVTTATSAFILHYLGIKAQYYDVTLMIPTGSVAVGYGCTGAPLIILMLKILVLVAVIFSLTSLQKLKLSLIAIGTGFFLGCVRVAVLVYVVNDNNLFHYWHDAKGSQIFLSIATITFVGFCSWVIPVEDFYPTTPAPQFRFNPNDENSELRSTITQFWRLPLLAITWLGVVFAAVYLACVPSSGRGRLLAYTFPDSSLSGWQMVSSKPITLVKDINPGLEWVQTGKEYRYIYKQQQLEISMLYVVNTLGNADTFFKQLTGNTSVKFSLGKIKQLKSIGYYALTTDSHQAYLTACINPRGGSSVTSAQFLQNRISYDFTWNRITPWLLGTSTLKDNRGVWVQLSIPLDGTTKEQALKTLESIWSDNYPTWQKQFPSLR